MVGTWRDIECYSNANSIRKSGIVSRRLRLFAALERPLLVSDKLTLRGLRRTKFDTRVKIGVLTVWPCLR